jgi:hypothetical protein
MAEPRACHGCRMITAKEFRELALSFPESVEAPHFDRASFRVRGKVFATIAPDGKSGLLKLDLDAHEVLLRAERERSSPLAAGRARAPPACTSRA